MRKSLPLMIFGLLISLAAIAAEQNSAPPKLVKLTSSQPTSTIFTINGQSTVPQLPSKGPSTAGKIPAIYRWIEYSSFECRVDWTEHCEGGDTVHAPPGFQVCNFVYTIALEGGARTEKSFVPDDWYTNDPQSPPRFRAFKFHIAAYGNGAFWDQTGAWIRLENVGITYIDADLDDNARYVAGCYMPAH